MKFVAYGCFLALVLLTSVAVCQHKPPHIIFLYVDDLGWNDVSFHGTPDIPTPNIDALGLSGIVLNNYYGMLLCTPSRGALLSGMYPIRLGLQTFLIKAGEDTSLPLNVTTLPQHLKKLGYSTHMIGKWHLGYARFANLPVKRGFDTFFGYLNGYLDYYDYTHADKADVETHNSVRNGIYYYGIDLYDGLKPVREFRGRYATEVFTEKATNIIRNHDSTQPLFLYFAHVAVHWSTGNQPLQAPPELIHKFSYIKNLGRRMHAAKMSALDDSVGEVFRALNDNNMLHNSIIAVVSDNGGQNDPHRSGYSSNYPLRSGKFSLWEGGNRVPAVIWSPLFGLQEQRISTQLMHVTDWLPTLYSAAGGDINDLKGIDGINHWDTLPSNSPSPRSDLLYNIDPSIGLSAYRKGDLKLIKGLDRQNHDKWYGPTGLEDVNRPSSMTDYVFRNGSVVRDIMVGKGWWLAKDSDQWYVRGTVTCQQPPPKHSGKCQPQEKPCLFNLADDPCEYHDLAHANPKIVASMLKKIEAYAAEAARPQSKPSDPRADPTCHNFTFVPWLEPEYYNECSFLED